MMTGGKLCSSKNLDQVSTLGALPEEREKEKERHPRKPSRYLQWGRKRESPTEAQYNLQWGRHGSAVKKLDCI